MLEQHFLFMESKTMYNYKSNKIVKKYSQIHDLIYTLDTNVLTNKDLDYLIKIDGVENETQLIVENYVFYRFFSLLKRKSIPLKVIINELNSIKLEFESLLNDKDFNYLDFLNDVSTVDDVMIKSRDFFEQLKIQLDILIIKFENLLSNELNS
jgi:hypothetical protein